MKIEENKLYSIVSAKLEIFRKEAKKHKILHRTTWWSTTFISLAIAFTSNFEFVVLHSFKSSQIAAVLGIILPAVTAYIVLRSPERLWIFEISVRNRLSDLKDQIVVAHEMRLKV